MPRLANAGVILNILAGRSFFGWLNAFINVLPEPLTVATPNYSATSKAHAQNLRTVVLINPV
jgi:hypothetical protein